MDDKKLNALNPDDNSGTTGSIDLSEGKSKEEIKQEAIDMTSEFGAAGVDDINKNLGSFGKTVVNAATPDVKEIKLDVDAKVVEKASKEEINFERFKKTKKVEKEAKTRFGEKVSMMLRTKKGLVTTWVLEMVIMVFIMVSASLLLAFFTRWWSFNDPNKIALMQTVQKPLKAGIVFAWIAIFPCLIPLIYLLTTWFIGINQVASSRTYHFIFWGFCLFSLVCLILALGLIGPTWHIWLTTPAYW